MSDDVFSVGEADDLLKAGQTAFKAGNLEAAYDAWTKAIQADPSQAKRVEPHLRTLRERIVAEMVEEAEEIEEEGETAEAIDVLRKAVRYTQDDPDLAERIRDRIESYEAVRSGTKHGIFWTLCGVYVAAAVGFALWIYAILE